MSINRLSWPPASNSNTFQSGFSERRLAIAQPALPAPTTMKSWKFSKIYDKPYTWTVFNRIYKLHSWSIFCFIHIFDGCISLAAIHKIHQRRQQLAMRQMESTTHQQHQNKRLNDSHCVTLEIFLILFFRFLILKLWKKKLTKNFTITRSIALSSFFF